MSPGAAYLLLELAIKSTVILGVALLGIAAIRRFSAEERHLVLALAVLGLLVLPLATAVMPKTELPVDSITVYLHDRGIGADATSSTWAEPVSARRDQGTVAADRGGGRDTIDADARALREGAPTAYLLVQLYTAVAGLILAYVAIRTLRVARRLRALDMVTDAATLEMATQLARELRIRRRIRLLSSMSDRTPWAWGFVRPVVVLPEQFRSWSEEEQRNALVHELSHVRRLDLVSAMLGQICCAVYWFQPLAWLAVRRMRREAEQACDDRVLLRGADHPAYARQLLSIAEAIYTDGCRPPRVTAMAGTSMSHRIKSILDTRIRRRTVSKFRTTCALLLAVALIGPLATLQSQETAPDASSVARLDDPAFQALLGRGPADNRELDRIVETLLANDQQSEAEQVLIDWITREDRAATGALLCNICIEGLTRDSRPRSDLTSAVLGAFGAVEALAYERNDGELLVRLADISVRSQDPDAIDRGLHYLLLAGVVGNAGDARPTVMRYLIDMGRFDAAKTLADELYEDESSPLYQSASMEQWSRYLESQQERARMISSRLLRVDSNAVPEEGEYLPLYKAAPVYPADAARQQREGEVIVEYTVTSMGRTRDVTVFRSTDPVFDTAAVESAKKYRYVPRVVDGVPVEVPGVRTKITFGLER